SRTGPRTVPPQAFAPKDYPKLHCADVIKGRTPYARGKNVNSPLFETARLFVRLNLPAYPGTGRRLRLGGSDFQFQDCRLALAASLGRHSRRPSRKPCDDTHLARQPVKRLQGL